MRKKTLGYSLLFFLVGGLFLYFLSHQGSISSNQELSFDNEEIIAPAITDALTDITRVPSLQGGLVKKIHVAVGQLVKKGQPLLSLDDTAAKHNVTVTRIALIQAKNSLISQKNNLKHLKFQLKRLHSIDPRAISRAELREKKHELNIAQVQLEQLQQNLDLTQSNLKSAELALSQYTVVAPQNGIVLQINIHVNEFVGSTLPIIFLGDAQKIIVRVSIDERDTNHFSPTAAVHLTSNENDQLKIPLIFMQLDRYIITQERLNSRVQEALYYFNRKDYPTLAAGQQFDAHIAVKTN